MTETSTTPLTREQLLSELKALRASYRQLESILRGIDEGITVQDRSGRLVFANLAAARLMGMASVEELLATPHQELLAGFELLDKDGNRISLEALPGRRVLMGAEGERKELRFRWKASGREQWSVVYASPLRDEDGELRGVINVFHDVTDHKRSERASSILLEREQAARAEAERARSRLAFLAEASTVLAGSLDYEETLKSVAQLVVPRLGDWCTVHVVEENQEVRQLAVTHRDPEKVAWANELQRRYPPVRDSKASYGIHKVLRTGEPDLIPEITDEVLESIVRDEGQLALLRGLGLRSSMVVPMIARGRILGTISLISAESGRHFDEDDLSLAMDLANRAAIAVENARLYEEARQAIELRETILSVTSHELRTPLTSILGFAQLLQRPAMVRDITNPRVLQALDAIYTQSHRLNKLIEVLLDFSRLQSGRVTIARRMVDIAALARRVASDTRSQLEIHELDLQVPEQPLLVEGDEVRLEQVLRNLVENAVKYSPDGGAIGLRVAGEGKQVVCVVSDEGIGIPEEAQSRLFSSFFRANNAEQQNISGLGLGLYIVKESISLHRGRIEVDSTVGRGTTITVYLPRVTG